MRTKDEPQDEFMGQRLPGTGGDFIDGTDVEGHKRIRGEDDVARRDAEPEGVRVRAIPDVDGTDVEGHRAMRGSEPDGVYRGGPTTQGEVIRRGPGDNPHGER